MAVNPYKKLLKDYNSAQNATYQTQVGSLANTRDSTVAGSSYSNVGTRRLLAGEGYQSRGGSHNNMPPFVTKYCWERTA